MKNNKLKGFEQFLNEAELRGNKGIPSDFMSNAEEEARKNIGARIDSPGMSSIGSLMSRSTAILLGGQGEPGFLEKYGQIAKTLKENPDLTSEEVADMYRVKPATVEKVKEVEKRMVSLESLAEKVIMEQFSFVIETSPKPIEIDIRLIRPGESVVGKIPTLMDKAEEAEDKPEHREEEQEDVQTQSQPQSQEEEDEFFSFFDDDQGEENQGEEEELPEEENQEEEITNKDIALAMDKTKILNMMTQGAGKLTKDIIKFSDTVSKGMKDIFGDGSTEILDIWGKISDEADKLDWEIPIGKKQAMFKNAPGGVAGGVHVTWESLSNKMLPIRLLTESKDFNKIVIRAYGIDFPMLIHEAVKGFFMILQSGAIKQNPETAEEIKRGTSSYRDEAQDFRYGPFAMAMFRDFVNACSGAGKYPNTVERIFAALALDKGRGGKFSDEEFLSITKDIFSSFRKIEEAKLRFVIDDEKFAASEARVKIEAIIDEMNTAEDEYQEELRRWEMEQRFGGGSEEPAGEEEKEDDISKLIAATAEREQDYANMAPSEIQELIDAALDEGDFEKVKMLSQYLGESASVYLKELMRINEMKSNRK